MSRGIKAGKDPASHIDSVQIIVVHCLRLRFIGWIYPNTFRRLDGHLAIKSQAWCIQFISRIESEFRRHEAHRSRSACFRSNYFSVASISK